MKNTLTGNIAIPTTTNFVHEGHGTPVILIHGLAASLHDWDDLIPELTQNNYASYALDLLGHGESPRLDSRAYQMEWMLEHFLGWMRSLHLTEPAIVIGHSLGGYIALEYARRVSAWTRGLILVNPFYSRSQLPLFLRNVYRHSNLSGMIAGRTPRWLFRMIVDLTSVKIGHSAGAIHALPDHIRAQTALDYTRTAPGVYNLLNEIPDLTEELRHIEVPTLIAWGENDQTLAPTSFTKMVKYMPRVVGKTLRANHVPHQSNAAEFNQLALEFLRGL
ncbi:MAG: alpha/beta hydrolase [Chloroflexota bacterium]